MSGPPRAPRGHSRRRRSSRFPKIAWPQRQAPPAPLAGQAWTPGESPRERAAGRRTPRRIAILTALAELGLLAWLLVGPAFQVRQVSVVGNHQMNADQVVSAAGLRQPRSVFATDAGTIRRKLTALAWVRDARVTTTLPDRVTLTIDEWQPVAVYVAGGKGQPLYLSDQAAILGPAPDARAALEIDGPAGPDPKVGTHPLEGRLLTAAVNIRRGLPGLVGQEVRSFTVDRCGDLTMTVQRGWRVDFGRVITPEEFAALNQKLAALKSVASKENLNNPDLDYINLNNAQLPAVGLKSRPAASPAPAIAQPSPSALAPKVLPPAPCR